MDILSIAIWEKLSNLAKTQKKPLKMASKITGVSEGAISGWKKSFPTVDNLAYLAEYYGVTLDYLVMGKDAAGFSQEERDLITKYRSLPKNDKKNVRALVDSMIQSGDVGGKSAKAG